MAQHPNAQPWASISYSTHSLHCGSFFVYPTQTDKEVNTTKERNYNGGLVLAMAEAENL